MNIDDKNFCVVPFVQLNTRGKGDVRVCCSIEGLNYGIPKNLTIDDVNKTHEDNTYSPNIDTHFNLGHDSIDELWNSKFMKDFRMKCSTENTFLIVSFVIEWKPADLHQNVLVKIKDF